MMRYAFFIALFLLTACDQSERVEPFNLKGRWAWSTTDNCTGDANTMTIEGQRLTVKLRGRRMNEIENLSWMIDGVGEARRLQLRYTLQDHTHQNRFRVVDRNHLILDRLIVDGDVPQGSQRAIGRSLYRCPS